MATPIIEYKDVEILRKELVVLKHVDFSLSQGEFVYLVGRVGSGKSSLLKTMYGEIPVGEGEARVLDRDLTTLRRKEVAALRREIGIVFQDFQLLTDRSVYDNLDFVLRATQWRSAADRDNRIAQVLRQVGMDKKSYKHPHELSGGEQQRIVIARALLNSPRLILADEPTGNLDPETSRQIVEHLRQISQDGAGVVMATHNLALTQEFPAEMWRCQEKRLERLEIRD